MSFDKCAATWVALVGPPEGAKSLKVGRKQRRQKVHRRFQHPSFAGRTCDARNQLWVSDLAKMAFNFGRLHENDQGQVCLHVLRGRLAIFRFKPELMRCQRPVARIPIRVGLTKGPASFARYRFYLHRNFYSQPGARDELV